jgi:hypothetical protein
MFKSENNVVATRTDRQTLRLSDSHTDGQPSKKAGKQTDNIQHPADSTNTT